MKPHDTGQLARLSADEAWGAVLERDAAMDGRFVYAVRTTGIFCRPSCPSRRPLRKNVQFLADAASAVTAGFRPCRRCQPDGDEATPSAAVRAAERARSLLEAHPETAVSLEELARQVKLSPSHLQRTFTRLYGTSPRRYAAALRADRFKAELREAPTVSRATFDAGFGASSRAYDAAASHLGMTPAAYRRGGRGVEVRYATAATAVGRILVAATRRGVCSVTLGDDDAALEAALAREYPEALRERLDGARLEADPDLSRWLASAVRAAGLPAGSTAGDAGDGKLPTLADVPLDVNGTPFQDRVWRAVRAIPPGEVRSYSEVAAVAGVPRAVRAVASAIASNPVALMVPCHRVVPKAAVHSTGRPATPGSYRWGAERKARLLERERAAG